MISDEQLKARKLGIGGSDMPIILGISNYKSPLQLYLEKKGIIESTQEETQLQYWGNRLESVVREEFAKRNNVEITTPDTIIHPFLEFMRANVDGFINEWNSVLEVKTATQFMSELWGEDGSDIIPLAYLVQVAHYCAVLNADSAYIAVLIGGHDYRQFKYQRDLELEKTILNAASEFWSAVQNDNPPPPTKMIDLKILFPRHTNGKTKEINDEAYESFSKLCLTKNKIKELEKLQNELKFIIMRHMEDAECLTNKEGKTLATCKANKNGTRTLLLKAE